MERLDSPDLLLDDGRSAGLHYTLWLSPLAIIGLLAYGLGPVRLVRRYHLVQLACQRTEIITTIAHALQVVVATGIAGVVAVLVIIACCVKAWIKLTLPPVEKVSGSEL